MKVVAASLYGTGDKYLVGALENARLAKVHYPGWTFRLYVRSDVPRTVVDELASLGCDIVEMAPRRATLAAWVQPMFWRFLATADPSADVVVVRDVDSRFDEREAAAVEEWLASGRAFHVMRDHPLHALPMLGGMWGCRGDVLRDLPSLLRRWQRRELGAGDGWFGRWRWGADQAFLLQAVYPRAAGDALIHSEIVSYRGETVRPFPTPRRGLAFVGEPFGADGKPLVASRALLIGATPAEYDVPVPASVPRRLARTGRHVVGRVARRRDRPS